MNPKDTPDLEEQKLVRAIDTIQTRIWARINDEATERGVVLNIGDAYSMGSVIKEVLHPAVRNLLHQHHNALLRELEGKLPESRIEVNQDGVVINNGGGFEECLSEVKQILADARVGEENV